MMPQQQTPQPPRADWSKPDPKLDERELAKFLSLPLSIENLQPLLVSNMFAVQDAYDRRVLAPYFCEILVNSMNFNNFMARVACVQEMQLALETGEMSTTWLKAREGELREKASGIRQTVIATLKLLHECRQPEDPVS